MGFGGESASPRMHHQCSFLDLYPFSSRGQEGHEKRVSMLRNLGVNTKALAESIEQLQLNSQSTVLFRQRRISAENAILQAREQIELVVKRKDQALSNFNMIEKICVKSKDDEMKQICDRTQRAIAKVLRSAEDVLAKYGDMRHKVSDAAGLSDSEEYTKAVAEIFDKCTFDQPKAFDAFGEQSTHITNQLSDPISRNIAHSMISCLVEYSVALERYMELRIALDIESIKVAAAKRAERSAG